MSDRDDTIDVELVASSSDSMSPTQMSTCDDPPYLQLITSSTSSQVTRRKDSSDVPYLRAVPAMPEPVRRKPDTQAHERSLQLPLFPGLGDAPPSLLAFLDMSTVSDKAFIAVLSEMCPRWLLDLRPAPRFDYGRLNRRLAFRLFSEHNVTYLDIAASLSIRDRHDARLHAGILSQELNVLLAGMAQTLSGPVVILLDDQSVVRTAMDIVPGTLLPRPRRGWIPRRVAVHGDRYSLV